MTIYKRSTWSLLFSLYATQYVGISFLLVALVAILRSQGMPLEKLSIVYSLGIFWVFKFLWAPLIDRFFIASIWSLPNLATNFTGRHDNQLIYSRIL